jgi:hypothetical protein
MGKTQARQQLNIELVANFQFVLIELLNFRIGFKAYDCLQPNLPPK